jgi:tetratricopeptide (TPR) repeat protein
LIAAGERRVGGRAEGTEGRAPKKRLIAAGERRDRGEETPRRSWGRARRGPCFEEGRTEAARRSTATGARLRRLLAAAGPLLLAAGLAAQTPAVGPQAEEAADFARRAALAALHGPAKVFLDSLDSDGILQRLLGPRVWSGLTARQQDLLRTVVSDHFAQALAPPQGSTTEIAWVSAEDPGDGMILADLGLKYGDTTLKTRWLMRRGPKTWTVEDVVLVDPGLSLSAEVGRLLGPEPVLNHDVAGAARARAIPRLAGLAAIALVVLVSARRLPRERRRLLWIAGVPALLFLVDGVLAVERALSEPYALAEGPPPAWRQYEKTALASQSEGRVEAARDEWGKALASGAPAGPVDYQMGLAARGRGATSEAKSDFERGLGRIPPAPGCARELATMALAEGRNAEASDRLQWYLRAAGPDPDALATLAVAEINLGRTDDAVAAIAAARALIGEDWRKSELEAQIYARAGNGAAAVAALRPLEGQGKLDRAVLRAEPAYLPIATDPAWVAFLNEPNANTP